MPRSSSWSKLGCDAEVGEILQPEDMDQHVKVGRPEKQQKPEISGYHRATELAQNCFRISLYRRINSYLFKLVLTGFAFTTSHS